MMLDHESAGDILQHFSSLLPDICTNIWQLYLPQCVRSNDTAIDLPQSRFDDYDLDERDESDTSRKISPRGSAPSFISQVCCEARPVALNTAGCATPRRPAECTAARPGWTLGTILSSWKTSLTPLASMIPIKCSSICKTWMKWR